ncbi:hypothetical protein IFM89_013059 [Coptis chinensis]|uniref:Uncharacterized protein n=1 Tax=Coptis chinensis TaxID=261450 RepID=A0A835HJW2_9MAGN|nr:hypothetical protein IFM89_013059 [Coptis chinensis]
MNLFSECANAPTMAKFQDKLAELKRIGGTKIEEFIVKIPFEHWANACFQGCRYGEMCSTLAECFNAWIKEEHSMPVTAMLYHIRRKMMKMFDNRCRECFSWRSELCPVMESVYCAKVDVARSFRVVRSNEVEFEVEDVIVIMSMWNAGLVVVVTGRLTVSLAYMQWRLLLVLVVQYTHSLIRLSMSLLSPSCTPTQFILLKILRCLWRFLMLGEVPEGRIERGLKAQEQAGDVFIRSYCN